MNYNMDYVKKIFTGDAKYKTVGIIVALLCLIIVSIYVYKKNISAKTKDTYVSNKEFVPNDGSSQSATLYYFYTTWCPHCKKTMPIWDELVTELNDEELKGVKLTLIKVDCDKEQSLAESFNVQGYPTIKLLKDGQIIEYDAKPSKVNLIEFVNTSLKN